MKKTINGLFTIIAITAFGMISAPTLSTINTVFAAKSNPFDNPIFKNFPIPNRDLFNVDTPDSTNNVPQQDNTPKSNNNDNNDKPKSNNNDNNDKPKSNN